MKDTRHLFWLLAMVMTMTVMTSSGHPLASDVISMRKRSGQFDESAVTHCRLYPNWKLSVNRDFLAENGTIIPCSAVIDVSVCVGGCDTSEIPDYKVPFKIINHPVCTYGDVKPRTVRICGDDHPAPFAEVFDAVSCVCQPCSRSNASCESL
nr:thyrostimulin beta-5 subunit [Hediste diversicolor]